MNPAQPQPGARLCALADIPEPGSKGFIFREGEKLFMGFIVRRAGAVMGFIDRCPHTGLPLALAPDRYLTRENDLILCSSHGALFRTVDGYCVAGPCAGQRLWPWPVRVEGDHIVAG
ncbi:MAG TPA: Rieske 2Fe-2S domain-containing protein [Caulobacteraceae bacterium]|nr:Rieske 2Fe-2S domain-containing protein [Caulobacteraceae bacterium]